VTSGEILRSHGAVYALTTPEGTPFYVGATMQRVRERANQHLRDAREQRKSSALHQLLASTRRVGFWVLEDGVDPGELGSRERHWKFLLEESGFEMVNYHHGANGCNRQPAHIRTRISAHARKRPRDSKGHFLPAMPAIAGGAPELDAETWDELRVTNTD
jgi:hypothetical protein